MPHIVILQYDIVPSAREDFERAYRSAGDWAVLFRTSDGYLGTQLLRDLDLPNRYITIDYWRSASAFAAFKHAHGSAYSDLDRRCTPLMVAETFVGGFDSEDERSDP
jgi:heme-degrading monooxygenase HmoA